MSKKIFKRIIEAFGGAALYMDKSMLRALNVRPKDEVIIEITDDKLIISKPLIDIDKIKEILSVNDEFKK